MRRGRLLVALGVVLFLVISGLLARFLSTENAERDRLVALLDDQAAGNVHGMLARLGSCASHPSCRATVESDAAAEHGLHAVEILALSSPTAYSLAGATGQTRVAWKASGRLPVVQCVLVRRTGNFLEGISISLLALSGPMPGTAECP